MKKILSSVGVLIALALGTNAFAAAFTAGNIVVYRIGNGTSGGLTNFGSAVFLDEYTTSGSFVQSIPVATNAFSATPSLTEGYLTLSVDGQYLVFGGYAVPPQGAPGSTNLSLAGTSAAVINRNIGRVDVSGNVDTSTKLTDFASGGNPRGAATVDGKTIFVSGSGGTGNYRATTLGATTSGSISASVTTPRTISVWSNQLYGSAQSGAFRIFTIGSGVSTNSGQICTNLPGFSTSTGSPYSFVFLKLKAGGADPLDTLYYCDDTNRVYKFSLVGGNWVTNGFVIAGSGVISPRGMAGNYDVSGTTNVHLYIATGGTLSTGSGALFDYTDTTGYNATPDNNGSDVGGLDWGVNATANTTFRGVAFVPSFSGPANLIVNSVGAFNANGFAGGPFSPSNQVYTLSNTGTNSLNWTASNTANWLSLSATNGTLTSGASTNITAFLNANANSLTPGSYSDTIGFTNTTNGTGNTTRSVTLGVAQFGVSPSAGFSTIGPVGGAFNPTNIVYTLTNGSSSVSLTWGASASSNWITLSATSGTLPVNGSTNITVSVNANANSLTRGTYADTVAFTNAVSDPGNTTRLVTLTVGGGFTSGNLVIYRVGDGSVGTLPATGSPVFLDEYDKNGNFIQSIPVSTNSFCSAGSGLTEGLITRSADAQFLVFPGYATNGPVTGLATSSGATVNRVAGRIDGNGNLDLSTKLADFASGGGPRGVASTDGNDIWLAGSNIGIRYTTLGATSSTALNATPSNTRSVNIFSNQLYASSQSVGFRIYTVGSGLPTNSGQTCVNIPGIQTASTAVTNSPFEFMFFKMIAGGTNPVDTLYFADDGAGAPKPAGFYKYSLIGGTNWVENGMLPLASAHGLVGELEISGITTNVRLYVTAGTSSAGTLTSFTDTNGWNAAPAGTTNYTVTSASGLAFRGIAFAPNISVNGNLTVTPASDFTSTGNGGGPFSPSNKVYLLSNTGAGTLTWSVSKTVNWLNLSATNGTLLGGASTNVTISLNANANSLLGGIHSDTVSFENTLDGNGDTTRDVTLAVTQFGVTPATTLDARGPVGGGFSPSSQIYTLTNISSSSSLTWGASKSATWLTLSSSSGVILANGSATLTVSVNGTANSLARGVYNDTVTITNTAGDPGNATRAVSLSVGFGFYDDFSSFSSGNLVGQQNWKQLGTTPTNLPLQVSGGKVGIPYLQTSDNQDAYKDYSSTNVTLYAGMTLNVTNAPTGTNSAFIVSLITSNGGSGFQDARVNAHAVGGSQYQLGIRFNGTASNAYVFGSSLEFGTNYIVIIQAAVTNDGSGSVYTNMALYVNPTSGVLTDQTVYANQFCVGPTETSLGSFNISQFASGSTSNSGVLIGKACVEETFLAAYNDLVAVAPPADVFATWQFQYFSGGSNNANAAGNADPDGDGMSNTNEFQAGFNPTNNAAYLKVISIVRTNNDAKVTYLGASGDSSRTPPLVSRTNVLEFTTGTGNGSYTNNFSPAGVTNVLSGGAGLGTVTNMVDSGGATNTPARYYRVRVLVP